MSYSTQTDYLPIPPGAMGTLFDPERLKKGYVTQEIGDGVHYVTSGGYDAMFVQTGNGVIVVDTPRVRDDRLAIGPAAVDAASECAESRAIYVVAYIDVREQPARRNADPGTPRPSVSRDAAPTKPLLC